MPESGLPGGVTAFTGLSDTPLSYTGQAGKVLTVNPGETGVIFTTIGGSDGNGIYTGSGSLSSNTTVTMGAFDLGFTGTGNVGIGTSTPLAKLDIDGNTSLASVIQSDLSASSPLMEFVNNDATFGVNQETQFDYKQGTSTTSRMSHVSYASSNWGFKFYTYQNFLNSTPTLTLRGDNLNGINTASPLANFQVQGVTGNNPFRVDDGAAGISLMVLNGGNVGIGTTTPTEKLEVAGNAYTTGQGSFGTPINPNSQLQVTASGKIVGIASNSNAITAGNGSAIRGLATSTAAVEVYGVDGEASGTNATGDRTGVRGNAITTGSRNHYGGKFFSNNGSSQNIGVSGTTGNGTTGTIIRGVFGSSLYQGSADAYGGYFSAQGASTGENIGIFATAVNGASNYAIKSDGNVNMANLPTSSAGLSAGDLWNNAGVINIV